MPKVLQTEFTKPFYLCSKVPAIGAFKVDFEEVKDILYNGVVEHLEQRTEGDEQVFTYVPYSLSYLLRYFPTPQGYGLPSDYGKFSLYQKYDSGRYEKKYKEDELGNKVFDACLSRIHRHNSMQYLLSKDYCYQDERFYKMAKFWTSRPFTFPLRKDGLLTGENVTVKLSLGDYFRLLHQLYTNVKLNQLRKFYLSQESIDGVLAYMRHFHINKDLLYLAHYPNVFYTLPYSCNKYDFVHLKRLPEYSILNQLCLRHHDLYDFTDTLRFDVIDYIVNTNVLTSSYRKELYDKIINSEKKKKYNEYYSDLHQFKN